MMDPLSKASCERDPFAHEYFAQLHYPQLDGMRSLCNHGYWFEKDTADEQKLSARAIRARWPRFFGTCAECGYSGIYYDSYAHYVYGDW